MDYETIEIQISGALAIVSLRRPEVRNAFNAAMIAELTEAFGHLDSHPDMRVVVLRGDGPCFSAGADVSWMRASLDFTEQQNLEDARRMSDMFAAIDACSKPVVCRVHGAALGGGMGLIAVCDVAIAAEGTVFGFTEAKLGIVPAVISRFVIPKIGHSWARALFLTAERFGPETARQLGLIHWVAAPDDLDSVVGEQIQELLTSGPHAVTEAKKLVAEINRLPLAERREVTARRIAELRASEEGQEGLRAFLEKRRPRWVPGD